MNVVYNSATFWCVLVRTTYTKHGDPKVFLVSSFSQGSILWNYVTEP